MKMMCHRFGALCGLTQFAPKNRPCDDDNSTEPDSMTVRRRIPEIELTNRKGQETIMHQTLTDVADLDDQRIQTIRMLLHEDAYVINFRHLVSKVIDFEVALYEAQNDPV
jgi:hypothetical protein